MERSSWQERVFTPVHAVVTAFLFAEVAIVLGVALWPAVALFGWAEAALPAAGALRFLGLGVALAAGYLVFGLGLLAVLPVARWLTLSVGTPVGRFRYLSLGAWRWASFNALTLVLRFSFVNWIRLTPLLPLYHRLMGARIGRRVHINTAVVADQNLLEIGDDTVIGGDVTLVCHAAERGHLVTAPVRIGRRVTVGLMAVILPGCTIGDGAVIAAGSVLSKGARVGPGEIWAGVPARRAGRRRRSPEPLLSALLALTLGLLAACSPRSAPPAPSGSAPEAGGSSAAVALDPLCRVLAEAAPGEIRDGARFEELLPVNLGWLLLEARTDLDVPAVMREEEVEVSSVLCPSGNRALWFPGATHPEQLRGHLVRRAAEAGRSFELVKWVGIGPSTALARLRQRCRDPSVCARLAAGASPSLRCYALQLLDADAPSWEECEKLPPARTECALRALGTGVRSLARRCVEEVRGRP